MGIKKIPMRMCTACREMKPKAELVRVVKTAEGEIKLDTTGKLNGRGAYICRDVECVIKAEKQNSLSRAFETSVDKEIYNTLKGEIEKLDK